jgi:hypothetical protein
MSQIWVLFNAAIVAAPTAVAATLSVGHRTIRRRTVQRPA